MVSYNQEFVYHVSLDATTGEIVLCLEISLGDESILLSEPEEFRYSYYDRTAGENWIRTGYNKNGGVIPYFTEKGYIYSVTDAVVQKGTLMYWTANSHVAIVTYADGSTIKYACTYTIPELSPPPTPAPGAWFLEPAKNQEFDWTASSYDYACYIMELQTEESKVIINPVRWIFEFEEERWFAEGNQEELTTGYDVLDEEIDPVELAITKKTEFHMSPMPGDYAYSYVKEHCDRYFHGELVTSDPVLFKYYVRSDWRSFSSYSPVECYSSMFQQEYLPPFLLLSARLLLSASVCRCLQSLRFH